MRIVLVGDFAKRTDEGMRKVCARVADSLSRKHDLLTLSTKSFCTLRHLAEVREFAPDCIHYLTGPTVYGLTALRAHKSLAGTRCTTIATGLRPYLSPFGRRVLPFVKPDWYLAQARGWKHCFERAGARSIDWPNSVDCERFRPASPEERRQLRAQHGFGEHDTVVLHVGHIRTNRNLETLIPLQRSGRYQVLIVGSESFSDSATTRRKLEAAGCRLITSYHPRIETIYQLADVFVFPTLPAPRDSFPSHYEAVGCIDLPLSVLEAMATGLAVAATRHDAAVHFLNGTTGLSWFDGSSKDALRAVEQLASIEADTRAAALRFDQNAVMSRLDDFYQSLATSSVELPS